MEDQGEVLFTSCIHGKLSEVQERLKTASVYDVNYIAAHVNCYTSLIMATAEGHQEVVSALLAHPDIDPNIIAWDGKSALIIAAEDGMTEIVSSLIAHPRIYINILDMDGFSPLMLACNNGHLPVVQLLLSHPSIDIHIQDSGGNTALSISEDEDISQLLKLYEEASLLCIRDELRLP